MTILAPDPGARLATRTALGFSPGQSEYLDALRGVAAQLVLVQHLLATCFPASGFDDYGLGALGVLTFFLLSGFLITDSVAARVETGRYSLTEFIVSRFSRIYTPLIPALLLVAALDWFSSQTPHYEFARDYNWPTAIANLLMLQDFPLFQVLRRLHVPDQSWFTKSFGSGRQFWTISIEWWIYVTIGIGTAIALARRASPGLLAVLAFAAITSLYNLVGGPGDSLTLFWLFGAGAAFAYRRFGRPLSASGWIGLVGLLALLAAVRLFFTHGRVYEAVFALLFCGLLLVPMFGRPGQHPARLLRLFRLDWLSYSSYSLYLTHGSIVVLLASLWPEWTAGLRGMILLILITNVIAVIFAALFEAPHRAVRRWLLSRLTAGAAIPAKSRLPIR